MAPISEPIIPHLVQQEDCRGLLHDIGGRPLLRVGHTADEIGQTIVLALFRTARYYFT
jgi:hypothetical protein